MSDVDEKLAALVGTDFGRYRVGMKIGAGGYAWVFRATDVELGRDIALKVLVPRPNVGGYPEAMRVRFGREARLVAQLRDPRSIKLIEHGEENGLLYIAFEFIEGESLDLWLEKGKPMRALRVAKILEQALESLTDAHHLGIVHRDIKPGNIMLYELAGRKDQVKVLDFGIGKFVDKRMTMDLTREGGVVGTPRYMAPEQLRGANASPASDIYALGLVAYELLTGERAIKCSEPMEAIAEIISEEDLRVPKTVDGPAGLLDVINKMLRKDLERRYASANEVLDDLQDLRRTTDTFSMTAAMAKKRGSGSFASPQRLFQGLAGVGLVVLIVWAVMGILGGDDETSRDEFARQFEPLSNELEEKEAPGALVESLEAKAAGESGAAAAAVEVASSVEADVSELAEEGTLEVRVEEDEPIPKSVPAKAVAPAPRREVQVPERQATKEAPAPRLSPEREVEAEEEVVEVEKVEEKGGPKIWSVD